MVSAVVLSSCATIVGGSTYNAHVIINNNHPNAQIIYAGEMKGYGDATFKVPRRESNKFTFSVKEIGFEEQIFKYNKRTFRVGAFIGSILLWTGITSSGIPLPWGPVIDLASGAIWKPSITEGGISQESTKNFKYLINYNGTQIFPDSQVTASNKTSINSIDVIYLKNNNIVKGIIIEQIPNEQIKIKASDGLIYVYQFNDIAKISKE